MKNLIIAIVACVISTGAFAQTDSSEKKLMPPDVNNDSKTFPGRVHAHDSVGNHHSGDPNNHQMTTPQDNKDKNVRNPVKVNPTVDGVIRQEGKMMLVKRGQVTPLSQAMGLANGSRIMPDGTLINSDGSKVKLKEGDYLDFTGNYIHRNPSEQPRVTPSPTPAPSNKSNDRPVVKPSERTGDMDRKDSNKDKNMYLVPDSTVKTKKKD